VRYVLDIISSVANERIGVLLVEQRAREALAISSRGYILDRGKIVLDGDAQALLDNQEMAELYLGAKGNH
jgi:branched-chain amino acid transport system ATP-binding protein